MIGVTFDPTIILKTIKKIEGPFIANGTYFFSLDSPDVIENFIKDKFA